jgi:hypothetical protein
MNEVAYDLIGGKHVTQLVNIQSQFEIVLEEGYKPYAANYDKTMPIEFQFRHYYIGKAQYEIHFFRRCEKWI